MQLSCLLSIFHCVSSSHILTCHWKPKLLRGLSIRHHLFFLIRINDNYFVRISALTICCVTWDQGIMLPYLFMFKTLPNKVTARALVPWTPGPQLHRDQSSSCAGGGMQPWEQEHREGGRDSCLGSVIVQLHKHFCRGEAHRRHRNQYQEFLQGQEWEYTIFAINSLR